MKAPSMTPLKKQITSSFIFLLLSVTFTFAGEPSQDLTKKYLAQKDSIKVQSEKAQDLISKAHNDFDAGFYKKAEVNHRNGRALEQDTKVLEQQLAKQLLHVFTNQIKNLSNENFEIRRSASNNLQKLGPEILPLLHELNLKDIDPETNARIKGLLVSFKNIEIDKLGRFLQWAKTATASSQYTHLDWSAMQSTGKPDTHQAGDLTTAWAPKATDAGKEWLELTFGRAIYPVAVRIHETYNPGAVIKVESRDEKGKLHTLWEGKDPTRLAPAFFEVTVPKDLTKIKTSIIRITLDTKAVAGWNEIDAVQLIGLP